MRNKSYSIEGFLQAMRKAAEFEGNLGTILDPMIITDEDGVILFANDAMTQVTGYSLKDIISRTPGEVWGNQRDESFYDDMWHTIKIEKKPFVANVLNRKKDGTYYSCDLKVYPVLDKNENINFFVGVTSKFEYSI